jgi:hypothetical protein
MTTLSVKPMRFDAIGVRHCKGKHLFEFEGEMCDSAMGFEQDKSEKSLARNEMENALRRLVRHGAADPEPPTPAELRTLFVDLCVRGLEAQASPLLGDVLLLTYMTDDFRREGMGEEAVRASLESDLQLRLNAAATGVQVASWCAKCLEHSRHLPV